MDISQLSKHETLIFLLAQQLNFVRVAEDRWESANKCYYIATSHGFVFDTTENRRKYKELMLIFPL